MAQIDLSRYTPAIPDTGRERQVFAGEGDVNAYKALANLGGNMANMAIDFHNKEMDIFTDRESQTALSQFKLNVADEQARALNNRTAKDTIIDAQGNDTGKTYDQHIAEYIDEQRKAADDSLTENISKVKFGGESDAYSNHEKIKAVFKNSQIVAESGIRNYKMGISAHSDAIIQSDGLNVKKNFEAALINLDKDQGQDLLKTNGTTLYNAQKLQGQKELITSALDTSIREAKTYPSAIHDFSALTGLGMEFKDLGNLKKYVITQYTDSHGEPPEEKEMNNILNYITGEDTSKMKDTDATPASINQPHEAMKTLTPEEKRDKINQMLSISFKNEKEKSGNITKQIKDVQAAPSEASWSPAIVPKWTAEFTSLLTDKNYQGDNTDKVRDVYTAADMAVMGDAQRYLLQKGSKGYTDFVKNSSKLREQYVGMILPNVMGSEDYQKVLSTRGSVGKAFAVQAEKKLLDLERNVNYKRSTNPNWFAESTKQYADISGRAIRVSADGKVQINPKELAHLESYKNNIARQNGTGMANLSTTEVLPNQLLGQLSSAIQIADPKDQNAIFKQINQSAPKVATGLVTQLIKDNKIDILDGSVMLNSQIGDSRQADIQNETLIALRNKYLKDPLQKNIKEIQTEGFFGKDIKFDDVSKEVDKQLTGNKMLTDLKEVSRANGLSEDQINKTFLNQNLRLLVLDKLTKTLPKETSMLDKIGLGTSFSDRVERATNEVMNDFYGSRLQVINSDSVKGGFKTNSIKDQNKVTDTATKLAQKVKDSFDKGELKFDLSDYKGMAKFNTFNNLPQDQQDKAFSKYLMDSISFNGTDITGKNGELVGMFKDKTNGTFYRIKLRTPDGKSYVPVIHSTSEFERQTEDQLFQNTFGKAIHNTTQYGSKKTIQQRKGK